MPIVFHDCAMCWPSIPTSSYSDYIRYVFLIVLFQKAFHESVLTYLKTMDVNKCRKFLAISLPYSNLTLSAMFICSPRPFQMEKVIRFVDFERRSYNITTRHDPTTSRIVKKVSPSFLHIIGDLFSSILFVRISCRLVRSRWSSDVPKKSIDFY